MGGTHTLRSPLSSHPQAELLPPAPISVCPPQLQHCPLPQPQEEPPATSTALGVNPPTLSR